jgi:hypothetical protein
VLWVLSLGVWWFIWFLGRMVNDGHDDSLWVTKLQRLSTFVANYEHIGDFRIENVNGVGGGNLPNGTIIGEVIEFIELL